MRGIQMWAAVPCASCQSYHDWGPCGHGNLGKQGAAVTHCHLVFFKPAPNVSGVMRGAAGSSEASLALDAPRRVSSVLSVPRQLGDPPGLMSLDHEESNSGESMTTVEPVDRAAQPLGPTPSDPEMSTKLWRNTRKVAPLGMEVTASQLQPHRSRRASPSSGIVGNSAAELMAALPRDEAPSPLPIPLQMRQLPAQEGPARLPVGREPSQRARRLSESRMQQSSRALLRLSSKKVTDHVTVETQFQRVQRKAQAALRSKPVTAFTFLVALYALFGDDLRLALADKSADNVYFACAFVCLAVFGLELLVNCITRSGYVNSLEFWLDFLCTASMVVDVEWYVYRCNVLLQSSSPCARLCL